MTLKEPICSMDTLHMTYKSTGLDKILIIHWRHIEEECFLNDSANYENIIKSNFRDQYVSSCEFPYNV